MLRLVSVASVLVVLVVTPITVRSFAEGPFPGFTGGFGEPTCLQCHIGSELNPPGGKLTLTGVPASFQPGQDYAVTVSLVKQGLVKGGFQLAARVASGASRGRDAGALAVLGPDLQLVKSEDAKTTYIQHTPAGTVAAKAGSMTWKFRWTAPKDGVPVRFDLAANASNNDTSPMDDAIFTATATAKPGSR
jgi:hypothetical protein